MWLCNLQHLLLWLGQGCKSLPGKLHFLTICSKRKFELMVEHKLLPLLTAESGLMTVNVWWPVFLNILLHEWSADSLYIAHARTLWLHLRNNAEEPNAGDGCSHWEGWKLECVSKRAFSTRGAAVSIKPLGWGIYRGREQPASFSTNKLEVLTTSVASEIESKQELCRKQMWFFSSIILATIWRL